MTIRLGPDPLRDHMTKACDPVTCGYCKKRRRLADEEAGKPPLDPGCLSCPEGMPENECPLSRRQCGHHCNCSWVHDHCHWCDVEFGEEEAAPAASHPEPPSPVVPEGDPKPEVHDAHDA